ncbi:MAG TPA: fibronectin type III domain-containing protein [Candidatus Dojkabacteria bacterium]|nr:fibronectin type III domain-containing protein [Candidatus Dojkabacteria bacterium]
MYINPKQKNAIIVFLILLIGIPLTAFATYFAINLITKASIEGIPKDVIVSNVTATSVTVSWFTEVKSEGTVRYNVAPVAGQVATTPESSPVVDTRGSGARYTHFVEITGLEPETNYTFIVTSDGKDYVLESGYSFAFSTLAVDTYAPVPDPVYGSIAGSPSDDTIVFITTGGSTKTHPVSALVRTGGNWIADLSTLKKVSDGSTLDFTDTTEIIILGQNENGNGFIYKGNYGDTFESSGKLSANVNLSFTEATSIVSQIPSGNTFVIATPVEEEPPIAEEPVEEEPIEEEPVEEEPVEEEPVEEEPEEEPVEEEPVEEEERLYTTTVEVPVGTLGGQNEIILPDVKTGKDSIIITNVTDTRFTVAWVSSKEEEGYVKFSTDSANLSNTAIDSRDSILEKSKYYAHQVDIVRLTPETKYYYEVHSGSDTYKNNTVPYELTTFAIPDNPPPYKTVTGKVTNIDEPTDLIVTAFITDKDSTGTTGTSTKISTIPDSNGSWIMSVGDVRTQTGEDYFAFTDNDDLSVGVTGMAKADLVVEKTKQLDDLLVTVPIKETIQTTTSKLAALSNYGIYGAVTDVPGVSAGIGGGEAGTVVVVPKTGISPTFLIFTLPAIILVALILVIPIRGKRNNRNKMINSL